MLYTYPHYYKKFQCIASACTDTCCAGWAITIDRKSLEQYRRAEGPMKERLRESVDWKQKCFKQKDHRCAFLNDENLCDLYTGMGPDSLCWTCKTYPRHIEVFDGVREVSLCLSCIEAARIILGTKEPVRFLSSENDKEESCEDEEFDFFLYTKLGEARDVIVRILENRNLSSALRMAMSLALAHDLQRRVRDEKLYEVDHLLERYQVNEESLKERFERTLNEAGVKQFCRFDTAGELYAVFEKMEPLSEAWPSRRDELDRILYGKGKEAYEAQRTQFLKEHGERLELLREQLMVYFVFGYFCGAVYNDNPYGKMKLAVAATMLVEEMLFAEWQKEKNLTEEQIVDLVHCFSREVEHSDENRGLLEEELVKREEFRLKMLLGAILEGEKL